MDTMGRYVKLSEHAYFGEDGCSDSLATVSQAFLNYNVGDTVEIDIDYISGSVLVNDKHLVFGILGTS